METNTEIKKEILLIDKPKGITSFDVIRRLRNKMGTNPDHPKGKWKMGHAGTLDPLATGLMIIGVGKGTKKLTGLVGLDKVYTAEILLGKQTDTGDLEGKIIKEKEQNYRLLTAVNKLSKHLDVKGSRNLVFVRKHNE